MIGHVTCPRCDAGSAGTHTSTCEHAGLDPHHIRSPLNDATCVMFVASGDTDSAAYEGLTYERVTGGNTVCAIEDCDEIVSTHRGRFHADFIVELAVGEHRCQAYFTSPQS